MTMGTARLLAVLNLVQPLLMVSALVWGALLWRRGRSPATLVAVVWGIVGLVQQGWRLLSAYGFAGGAMISDTANLVSLILALGGQVALWGAIFWALWAVSREVRR